MFEERDDTILARWLADALSPEELEAFEKTDEFSEYQAIADASRRFQKPDYNKDALFSKITQARETTQKTKVIRLKPILYSLGVACSILILLGLFFSSKTYSTGFGQQLVINLPDGSKVNLNANSSLEHSRFFWTKNRTVDLEGEAFFDVEKGQTFSVITESGTVSVLGTEFNVRAREKSFGLQCFEGKVKFEDAKANNAILTAGDAIIIVNGNIEKYEVSTAKPLWLDGVSSFNNQTLKTVIDELSSQYNIRIKNKNVDLSQRFTGSFVHNDIETALKTVLVPMDIKYTLQNSVLELSEK
ncbi:FecR family protein [Winogradskyella sp.]|uniref:FecR family protein n=1 Tax=Winogradskyella sp. TaxID=1883156 RepID=UPI003BAAB7EB